MGIITKRIGMATPGHAMSPLKVLTSLSSHYINTNS
jgi:hypothetical protein